MADSLRVAVPDEVDLEIMAKEFYSQGQLSIIVLGASGDLAKKKTYPSLLDLFAHKYLPRHVNIVGYARSAKTSEEFSAYIRPWLEKKASDRDINAFLSRCSYCRGSYDQYEDFALLHKHLLELEVATSLVDPKTTNRIFYFAIPPEAFLSSAKFIKRAALTAHGFVRLIVEKPFGHNLESAERLVDDLSTVFPEDCLYRIDHYLAKEMVQNLIMFRFGNTFLEPLLNNHHVSNVQITFKEDFGTEGRGGYFNHYGIIRDVIQNHLMQVLTLVAMEAPPTFVGVEGNDGIRDAKNNVLKCIAPIRLDEVVLGQYVAANGKPGYLMDQSILAEDKDLAIFVPTFASCVLWVDNARWTGVPFVLKAGKALNEQKAEIRIQFKDAPASARLFGGEVCPRNELVMQLQPEESLYMKVNVKTPGLSTAPTQSELDLTYKHRYTGLYNPCAYTRLILEALRGNQGNFVRSDEVINSWKLFSPLLEQLKNTVPIPYEYGSRGPAEADSLRDRVGFVHEKGYMWRPQNGQAPP